MCSAKQRTRPSERIGNNASALATIFMVAVSACDYARDSVAPGFYGETSAAGRGVTPASTSRPWLASAAEGGAGAASQVGVERPIAAEAAGTPAAGASGTAMLGAGCDLTGPWLLTLHKTTDALGNQQTARNYIFYELKQQGDTVSVDKGLMCGFDATGGGTFAVSVDFSASWPSIIKNVKLSGRRGTSVMTPSGCKIDFDEQYTVLGATLPHFLNPAVALPSAEEPATAGQPGWEDWDADGHPGITGVCSGTVTGKVFSAVREWSAFSGTAPDISAAFTLALRWDSEPNIMAFEGSPFLGSSAVRAADASLHFVQFARLPREQATGDDATLCKTMVALAPTLTPEAAQM